jgi:hypothetical protein
MIGYEPEGRLGFDLATARTSRTVARKIEVSSRPADVVHLPQHLGSLNIVRRVLGAFKALCIGVSLPSTYLVAIFVLEDKSPKLLGAGGKFQCARKATLNIDR